MRAEDLRPAWPWSNVTWPGSANGPPSPTRWPEPHTSLAAGADRDVSEVRAELRARIQVLNALRETQLEQGEVITELGTEMRERIDGLDREVREDFSVLGTGMAQITALLTTLTERDDS